MSFNSWKSFRSLVATDAAAATFTDTASATTPNASVLIMATSRQLAPGVLIVKIANGMPRSSIRKRLIYCDFRVRPAAASCSEDDLRVWLPSDQWRANATPRP